MTQLDRAAAQQSLVSLIDGQAVTTSKQVAEFFGKDHAKVLRDIRGIAEQTGSDFTEANFGLSEYTDATGRTLPAYRLTRDGFTLLAMGFTGKKALQFKLAYIDAFNRMEAELCPMAPPSHHITPEQQRTLQEAVAARADALPAAERGKAFPKLWGAIKSHFRVGTYKDLTPGQFDAALAFVHNIDLGGTPKCDALLESSDYRSEARQFASSYLWQLRDQLPAGSTNPKWVDQDAEARIADGLCASILERGRWILCFINGRLNLQPIANGAAVIDPSDEKDVRALLSEHLPDALLPVVAEAALQRIAKTNTRRIAA